MSTKMRQVLEKAYRAGVALPPTGTSLDYRTMEIEIEKLLPEVIQILDVLAIQNVTLKLVIEDLLEQHERQLDMEDCGSRCSYPDKFPEWDRAWKSAREVLNNG